MKKERKRSRKEENKVKVAEEGPANIKEVTVMLSDLQQFTVSGKVRQVFFFKKKLTVLYRKQSKRQLFFNITIESIADRT